MTAKQIKELAARYAKFVEWSEEDKCFIGRCPELMLGGVHGNDEAKVYAELCAAVEEMIEVSLSTQIARDYSGCAYHHLLHAVLAGKAGTGILRVGDLCERRPDRVDGGRTKENT